MWDVVLYLAFKSKYYTREATAYFRVHIYLPQDVEQSLSMKISLLNQFNIEISILKLQKLKDCVFQKISLWIHEAIITPSVAVPLELIAYPCDSRPPYFMKNQSNFPYNTIYLIKMMYLYVIILLVLIRYSALLLISMESRLLKKIFWLRLRTLLP